jgi:hypothetical protein
MGTSHRHTPTVKGEPNWGKASAALTGLVGDVEESDDLEQNPPEDKTPVQVEKRQNQLGKRIKRNYHTSVRNLVRASGGRHKVSSGGSRALGHGGIVVINNFISAIQEIVNNGLATWLQQRGVDSLEGKSCQNIIDFLRQYIESGVAGLDSTAANEAIESVMDRLDDLVGDNVDEIENKFDAILNGEEIKDIIDQFFGMYIYVHLSQDFEEKLEYEKGSVAMKNAMNEVKEQILDDIRVGRTGRDVRTVDWSKPEGKAFIQAEFDRILFILQGNED